MNGKVELESELRQTSSKKKVLSLCECCSPVHLPSSEGGNSLSSPAAAAAQMLSDP
jgi:hypothetical protein